MDRNARALLVSFFVMVLLIAVAVAKADGLSPPSELDPQQVKEITVEPFFQLDELHRSLVFKDPADFQPVVDAYNASANLKERHWATTPRLKVTITLRNDARIVITDVRYPSFMVTYENSGFSLESPQMAVLFYKFEDRLRSELYQERRLDLCLTAIKAAYEELEHPIKFVAVDAYALDGLCEVYPKERVLQRVSTLFPVPVYDFEDVKHDHSKFDCVNGEMVGAKNGAVLSVEVLEYDGERAAIEVFFGFANLNGRGRQYEARLVGEQWRLTPGPMIVS
ncbi:hypothetical protein ACP3TJ_01895 [Desulforudis sp. 1088]|uniref:hypothetical protein n=1 Tax=unclassified Candidatus Desulforudis TaxID=2635950 RepID=UPI003CE51800